MGIIGGLVIGALFLLFLFATLMLAILGVRGSLPGADTDGSR